MVHNFYLYIYFIVEPKASIQGFSVWEIKKFLNGASSGNILLQRHVMFGKIIQELGL